MKKKWIVTILIGLAFFLILLPFVVEAVYKCNPPFKFFNVSYTVSDLLQYYGAALSVLATIILSGITIYQTKRANEKSEEVNRISLELQRKSMEMAERQYKEAHEKEEKARDAETPKFEFKITGMSGSYSNMKFSIKNVSQFPASNITSISFEITDEEGHGLKDNYGRPLPQVRIQNPKNRNLMEGEETVLKLPTPILAYGKGNSKTGYDSKIDTVVFFGDVHMSYKFSCENQYGDVKYYEASCVIPNTMQFYSELWKCERIG